MLSYSPDPTVGPVKPEIAVKGFSSISTTSGSAEQFAAYAAFVEGFARRRREGQLSTSAGALEHDELVELASDLWTIHDNYHASST